ncbi:hypothetical protein DAEQUDRAFT_765513 [Daedalea quercina L-15889]|uniref:SMP domain-containing protein n=1 Tax=Daedalea quercina L-15889 TaxID=1314783 RepID=A0A165QGD1_9APHY|nr:hypothetical protein DAEQUDRAFT_765513 [Daedalea quercina L-15889]
MTTTTASIVTSEVPVVNGDILRATGTPSVTPPLSDRPASPRSRRPSIAEAVGIDLEAIGKAEARKIMSEEHRVLGFRPPHGSLAAEVQAAAAKHPEGSPGKPLPDPVTLKELARQDAQRILAERKINADVTSPGMKAIHANGNVKAVKPPATGGVNLTAISAAEARTLMSHEHKALGFRPPPGSLAAEAQAAASKHPEGAGVPTVDPELLKDIALKDAERIKADREVNMVGEVNVSTVGEVGAERIVNGTREALGHSPPPDSLAGEAQRAAEAYPQGGSFPALNGDALRLEELGRVDGAKLKARDAAEKLPLSGQADSVNGIFGDIAAVKLSDVHKSQPAGLLNPENFSVKHGIGSVLRAGGMRRMETGDSVEIIGDVIG